MKIYVVTHKKVENKLPENYEYIQVNAQKNGAFYSLNDADGENISAKNPYYCELTASYWIWKNDKQNDVVGLAHYRRFLTTNRFSSSPKHYVKAKKAENLLKKYDFISTKLYKTNYPVKTHLLQNVREQDFNYLRQTVSELYPDYLQVFDNVFEGNKSYLLNMFICKKSLWDEYYSWLFSIFDKLETKVDMTGYSVQEQRLYGFLAERLFTVFVFKNGYKVKSYPTHIVGESKIKILGQKLKKVMGID